jgi:phytoene dehydrogenase-like protein
MCSLYALNVLDKSEAFVKPLTPDVIVNTMLRNPTAKKFALENLSLLKRYRPGDTDFIDAIQRQINRPIWMANFQFRIRKKVRHVKEKLQRLRKLLQLS